MDWIQVLTIIGSMGAFIIWHSNKVDAQFTKVDADIKSVDNKIEIAHRRMDGLYNIIIEIQKEIKELYIKK